MRNISSSVVTPPVTTQGLTYEWRIDPNGSGYTPDLEVRCTGRKGMEAGAWMPVPVRGATSVFASPQGLVFFNDAQMPQEIHPGDQVARFVVASVPDDTVGTGLDESSKGEHGNLEQDQGHARYER